VRAVAATELRVAARDGFELAATRFDPAPGAQARGVVLIVWLAAAAGTAEAGAGAHIVVEPAPSSPASGLVEQLAQRPQ
jgi:hypothetical protein